MAVPSYLKSLEAVLGGGASEGAPSATVTPTLPTFLTAPQMAQGLTTSNGGSTAGKLKFLLVGTHAHQFTGYSKVTYNLVKILARQSWCSVTHFGFQKNPQMPPNYRS